MSKDSPNFILDVVGQKSHEDGKVIVVDATGFGARDGPLMTRAKARAIVAAGFGPKVVEEEVVRDTGGFRDERFKRSATRDETLFQGPFKGVRDRLQTFRKNGVFTEVLDINELETEKFVDAEQVREIFGENLENVVSTYRYRILVSTSFSFGP